MPEQIGKPPTNQPPPPGKQPGYSTISVAAFSGPLPHPEILHGYEAVCPGAAHRIIEIAESQSAHRRQMEVKELEAQIESMRLQFHEARRGQVFAFCVSALFTVCGALVVIYGHPWPGTIFGSMGIGGIVTTFIRGRAGKSEPQPQQQPPPRPSQGTSKGRRGQRR